MSHPFHNKFESVLEKDRSRYVKPFVVEWDYQKKRKKRGIKYEDDLPEDFYVFKGPEEVVNWMNWFKGEYPSFYKKEIIDPLYKESEKNDRAILKNLGVEYDFSKYTNVGLNNAHDFFIPQSYPVPAEFEVRTVLDFGAGYGRQANLWWPYLNGKGNFIGVDAIPMSYGLQNSYYKAIKPDFKDYIDDPAGFKIDPKGSELYHVPTWRLDLIPDNSVDLILCVQVLPELGKQLIHHIFEQFQRILKPGGAFYIRDLNYMYKTIGAVDIDKSLINAGFTLEYKAFIEHNKHLHGIPKIWRKNIESIVNLQKNSLAQKKRYLLEDIDAMTGGILKRKKK